MATPADEAAADRSEIEELAQYVYAAALIWVATHGQDEEPDDDTPFAKAAARLATALWRAMRRQYPDAPQPTPEGRRERLSDYQRAVMRRAESDARAHHRTVAHRVRREDPSADATVIEKEFKTDHAWSDAAARTMATRFAAETAMSLREAVEEATGRKHSTMWISQGDPKVRTLHRRLHGRVRPIGTPYHSWADGQTLSYPGDPKAPLDATINCRCVLLLVPTSEAGKAESVFQAPDADFDVPVAAAGFRSMAEVRAERELRSELARRILL